MTTQSSRPRPRGRRVLWLRGPRERPALALAPAALLALVGAGLASAIPQSYRGETLVQVEPVGEVGEARRDVFSPARREAAIRRDLLDEERLGRLVSEIGPVWRPQPRTAADLAATMSPGLAVRSRGPGVFAVRFEDPDPDLAVLVPNILTAELIEDTDHARQETSAERLEKVEERVETTRREVEEKEEAVRRLLGRGSTRAAPSPSSAARARLRSERESVLSALSGAEEREVELLKAIDRERQSLEKVDPGPASQLAELRAELAELRERYTDLHPDVQAQMRRIRDLEAQIPPPREAAPVAPSRLQQELEEVDAEIQAKREELASLDAELASLPARPVAIEETGADEMDEAWRELEKARELHLAALRRWEKAQTPDRLAGAGAVRYALLDPAQSADPTRPDPLSLGLLGLVVGLGIGVTAAVVLESRDDTVRSPAEAEELLGKPVLVSIPSVSRRSVFGFSRQVR